MEISEEMPLSLCLGSLVLVLVLVLVLTLRGALSVSVFPLLTVCLSVFLHLLCSSVSSARLSI
jgi:hypothetical protein